MQNMTIKPCSRRGSVINGKREKIPAFNLFLRDLKAEADGRGPVFVSAESALIL